MDIRQVALRRYIENECNISAIEDLGENDDNNRGFGGGRFVIFAHEEADDLWCVHYSVLIRGVPLMFHNAKIPAEDLTLEQVRIFLVAAVMMLAR